jgi:YD repeat-containing protein
LNNAIDVSYRPVQALPATYSLGTSCAGAGSGNPYQAKCSSDDAGNGKSFEYDTAGNLTKTTDSTANGTGAVTEQKTYERPDQCVCRAFAGQICTSTNAIGGVTRFSYNVSGDPFSVTPPAPLGRTANLYDSLDRVLSIADGNGKTTTFDYNVRDDVRAICGSQSMIRKGFSPEAPSMILVTLRTHPKYL